LYNATWTPFPLTQLEGVILKVASAAPAINPSHCTFSTVPQNSGATPEGYPSVEPEKPLKLQEIHVISQAIAEAVPLQEAGNWATNWPKERTKKRDKIYKRSVFDYL
jgi:hypothetical protein